MRYAVLGGDRRFAHLVELLREAGREAEGFFQEGVGERCSGIGLPSGFDAVIANWPIRLPESNEKDDAESIHREIAPGSTLLLCGPGFPESCRGDLKYVNLWRDEGLLKENAQLTAEAAVSAMAGRIGGPLRGMDCMVVGFGRIGRALTEILMELGAKPAVVSRNGEKLGEIEAMGAEPVSLDRLRAALPGRKLVFSTPPCPVLNREMLVLADGDAHIMDLASPPYGVDVEAAREMGLDAWREPGLPGRYCPLRAARAILHGVLRWEEEAEHG